MTDGKNEKRREEYRRALAQSLSAELLKTKRGAALVVSGVLGIGSFSESEICLTSHGGRLFVRGERLELSVFENRTIEIFGRITGVELGYGKT